MSKPAYNSTINDIVCTANENRPRVAAQSLADMVALAELDNQRNRAPWDKDSPVGGEISWMLVRTICTEFGVPLDEVINEARNRARVRYAEIEDEAHAIDQHDRFAVPDPNKERAASALIELIEG